MKINLAGFNVDIENIKYLNEILKKDNITNEDKLKLKQIHWTPESISASYARISRDPRSIDELRSEAGLEIDKARKSNKAIIFDMGHSSIAEHAVFNIDIINISRLLAELVEKSRLVSFTEKSQRYIKIGKDNYFPEELKQDNGFSKKYQDLVDSLFKSYNTLHDKILPYFLDKNPGTNEKSREYRDIVNLAKEDARYILPLSTLTQVGLTINARNLEKMIRKLGTSGLAEANKLGQELFRVVDGYAPSLVKYTSPGDYDLKTYTNINEVISGDIKVSTGSADEVSLVKSSENIETDILAGFIIKNSELDYDTACTIASGWDNSKREEIFNKAVQHMKSYDALLREFELTDFVFNILISATGFAQLKRHRMATILDGRYSPGLGVKIPGSIIETGYKDYFLEHIDKINTLYNEAKEKWPDSCDYILSNAHRKHVILKCNFRELTHIARLRCDKHAQWDIRMISEKMMDLVKNKTPLLAGLLCGKDSFK